MSRVRGACYVDGSRDDSDEHLDPERVLALLRRRDESLVWIDLAGDDEAAFAAVISELDVHALVVEDMFHAHQRAKLDQYGDVVFAVLRPATWKATEDSAEIGELHVLTTTNVVVTVSRGVGPDLGRIRTELEGNPTQLARGASAILHAILDATVDDYAPVVAGLEVAVDEVEDAVFGGEVGVARRVYRLMRQVIEVDRATEPLPEMVASARQLAGESVEMNRQLDDIADHTSRLAERVEAFRTLLRHALEVNSILVTEQANDESRRLTEASLTQGEQVKRISSWAAILFAPTMIASIYGMNFQYMPELGWRIGYPLALVAMLTAGVVLYRLFKHRNWL